MVRSILATAFAVALVVLSTSSALAVEVQLQNDGWSDGQTAVFQQGFIAGEMAGSRFTPPQPARLTRVQFLFGGATSTQTITLNVYEDALGSNDPGALLFTGDYQLTGSNSAIQEIDLTGDAVDVTGPFRVAIQFQHSGPPSVARDDDGTIDISNNFLFASGIGWARSSLFGLTGDWIIRAFVDSATDFTVGGNVSGLNGTLVLQNNGGDDLVVSANGPFSFATTLANGASYAVTVLNEPVGQTCTVTNGSGTIAGADVTDVLVTCSDVSGGPVVLQNDGFTDGANAGFQQGFVIGETAAVRLIPSQATQVLAVRFLYGGAPGTRTIRLHIWDDTALADVPGVELFAQDYQVTASDTQLQEIDLGAANVFVPGAFRVGIQFFDDGAPSVARDDDGTIAADRNFVDAQGLGWVRSSLLGVTGDWIIRAVVPGSPTGSDAPEILAIDDVGNDQGKQVRIRFAASGQDDPGSSEPVVRYEVFRRIDPLPRGAAEIPLGRLAGWDYVGEAPSHGEAEYSLVVPTLADSNLVDGMVWTAFFVRAATASPFIFFDSPVDSGYSIDDLAPAAPQNLVVQGAQLSWEPVVDEDLAYYRVYASEVPVLDGSATALGATAATSFDVSVTALPYLFVTALDFAGNEGPASDAAPNATNADSVVSRRLQIDVHPNPFNPATTISYRVGLAGPVDLRVFDARGRLVRTLLDHEFHVPGIYSLSYRSEQASGVYLLQLRNPEGVRTTKVGLVR